MKRESQEVVAAAGIGAIAGLRSLSAPAFVGHAFAHDGARGRGPIGHALSSDRTATTLEALAAGEAIADKTPWVPSRVEPLPLIGRALSGAVSAAAIGSGGRGSPRGRLAAIGAAAAVGSAVLAYRVRRDATGRRGIRNAAAGLAEDGLVAAIGAGLVAWLRRR